MMASYELPRVSTDGGGSLRRMRESSATSARANSTKTLRNFNNQFEIGEVLYNLLVIDDDTVSRITRQYKRIANDVPIDIVDYNLHGNIYGLRGNWGGLSRVYYEVITWYPEVKRIIDQSGLSQLWQLKMPKSDHKLLASFI